MENLSKLDKIDHKLLHLLQRNAKVTNAYLSQQIGLSQAAIFERVKRLENHGFIKNYYAQVDSEKAGLGATFFVQVSLANNSRRATQSFLSKIDELDEVTECHNITGSSNFLLKIVTRDLHSFQALILGEMSKLDEIGSLESMIVLSVMKDSKVVPIPVD
ncbi:MAG: Lrp/AsnC family transcriptional regulator [Cytophagales bacterium]|jgi:DNA-binding Lrp family transcriptional regulator|nr:Lrp/AsnC family transcriptional regulator [Cytophagales bacterium]